MSDEFPPVKCPRCQQFNGTTYTVPLRLLKPGKTAWQHLCGSCFREQLGAEPADDLVVRPIRHGRRQRRWVRLELRPSGCVSMLRFEPRWLLELRRHQSSDLSLHGSVDLPRHPLSFHAHEPAQPPLATGLNARSVLASSSRSLSGSLGRMYQSQPRKQLDQRLSQIRDGLKQAEQGMAEPRETID
jgi:hypothetical protein